MTTRSSLRDVARLLLLVGGIILILSAVLPVLGDIGGLLNSIPRLPSFGSLTDILLGVLVGVIALIGAGQVSSTAWSILLIILGYLGGGLGGLLVLIGGLIALVAKFV